MDHPTGQWTAQQLLEAFPFDSAPRYVLRDWDANYGESVRRRIKSLGIEDRGCLGAALELPESFCAKESVPENQKCPALSDDI